MRGDFRPLPNKNVQMLDHFFPLLVPKDSESLKIFDIRLWEVGAKRPLNGTSKVNGQTDRQTEGHTQTDISTVKRYLKSERTDRETDRRTHRRTFRLVESIGPEGRCFENEGNANKWVQNKINTIYFIIHNRIYQQYSGTHLFFCLSV